MWLYPPELDLTSAGPATVMLDSFFIGKTALQTSFSTILLFLQAVYLNYLVNKYRLTVNSTWLTGLSYILLMSGSSHFSMMSPVLFSNTFLIIGCESILRFYKRKEASGELFNVGFWIAVSSLFYHSNIVFILLAIMAMTILRQTDLREGVVLVLGVFTVYFLIGVHYFWHDKFAEYLDVYLSGNFGLPIFKGRLYLQDYIQLIIFACVLAISLASYGVFVQKSTMQGRLILDILYWMMLLGLLSFFSQRIIQLRHIELYTIPLAVFLGYFFTVQKSKIITEFLHLVIFMAAIANQYQDYFFN